MKEQLEGYVFLCSDATEKECFDRSLFGGGEKYVKRVKGIRPGKKLYLFNYSSKKLHGTFEALTGIEHNIVPEAWKGEYPWQVRVKRVLDHKSISREDIGTLLKFDRSGRPSSRLDHATHEALEDIFKNEKRVPTYRDDTPYITNDGHRVRSKGEMEIDNWLYSNRIVHGYEVPIKGGKLCDFEVPLAKENIYIEFWGLNDAAYLANKKRKENLYTENNLKLISVYEKDLKNLDAILSKELGLSPS